MRILLSLIFVGGFAASTANAAGQKPPPGFNYETCVAKLQKSGAAAREASRRCSAVQSGTTRK